MRIKNDIKLAIATANSRKAKTWKNSETTWSKLLDRLSKATVTPETQAEYKKMPLDQQSEIKDVGGFVGGYCKDGKRMQVASRSMICLDADTAQPTLWDDWALSYGAASAVYSTHKHAPDKPRLRLVIPLAREVGPDEYQAVARRIAADLGMEQFDDTGYQPFRLMFWPSVSQDGEYIFKYLDAPLLDPDRVLATYRDWRDVSTWPTSDREASVVRKSAEKQKDPLEKPGIVGAFCRAYSIEDAVAAFVPAYQPCDTPGRYTYIKGSMAAGVVVYEDKFTYSHHATDPASGQLCNAWDLVRLHKFGDLDEAVDPGIPATKRPSFAAMSDLVAADPRVRAQLVADRAKDFDTPIEQGSDWRGQLQITAKGGIAQTIDNVVIVLKNDPGICGALAVNDFTGNIMVMGPLPWRSAAEGSQWTDADDADLRYYLEKNYGLTGKDRIFDAVNHIAGENRYHPVRNYLDGRSWDGVKRLDTLLIDYLGAEDSAYTRAVTRKAMTAAVARIYRPGCKFDYMLTIRGRQGLGKSALISKLGGQWYSDSFTTVQGKDAYDQMRGVWLVEVGELAGMRRAEAETIKLFISKQADRYRPAYGRRTQDFPRQCVFIGTTNESQFLRDTTGNRRFWVVDTPGKPARSLWEDLTLDTIDQIWAEAVDAYRAGETLYLDPELEKVAREIQGEYEEENPKAGLIEDYLDRLLPEAWEDMDPYTRRQWLSGSEEGTVRRMEVSTAEIVTEALGGSPERIDRYMAKEVREIMGTLPGWVRSDGHLSYRKPYGRQRVYRRMENV